MAVVLRRFGGDGWADAGLRPRLRGNGRWYLLAAVAFPVMFALALALSWLAGLALLATPLSKPFTGARRRWHPVHRLRHVEPPHPVTSALPRVPTASERTHP